MGAVTSVAEPQPWRRNKLLAALPEAEQQRLTPLLHLVDLKLKDTLQQPQQPIEHLYFPLDCVVSVVAAMKGEPVIELSTIGAEGIVGLAAFLGATSSPNEAFCQIPGQALRVELRALQEFFVNDGALHELLHRYTQAAMVSLAQNVACNRLHTTEERCARWLAQTHDRVGRDEFLLTQEFLGQMLGVRRPTVSLNATLLQRAGLIRYSRGRITVLDRDGLHAAACDCYRLVRDEFDRLL